MSVISIILIVFFIFACILTYIIHKPEKEIFQKNPKIKYEYKLINTDKKVLKSIYNTVDSIEDVYLESYKNNSAIKVILIKNDEIVGDICKEDVSSILNLKIKTSKVIVENKLNNDGEMEYLAEIYGEYNKTN